MKKIILGFVGPIASGKGTACQYLKDKYGAKTYRFSSILRDLLDRLYLPQSRQNMQDISSILRNHFGDDLLAGVIAKDVGNDSSEVIAVDGVRREPDIKHLLKIPDFKLVHINAAQKIRYERIVNRAENTDDTQKTFEDFQKDELKEAEQQIKEVAKLAVFEINNDGTQEDLNRQIDEIVSKLKTEK